ncbi:MAG TPA: hypothetical protein VFW94_07950 [Candidatus Acidoferrales bacterium]|nr:hypothetical protein [Candidatus Acidoferrales bacterium]
MVDKDIKQWIEDNDKALGEFQELHVDKIDSRWKSRVTWIDAGLEVLAAASRIKLSTGVPRTLAVAYSLRAGIKPTGINFNTRQELAAEIDQSPPSLYMFREGHEPWLAANQCTAAPTMLRVQGELLGPPAANRTCIYFEFRVPGASEYARSIFVIA